MNSTKVDHYREAERLLEAASYVGHGDNRFYPDADNTAVMVAAAQVHATLALTDAQSREADADEVLASAVDPQGGRKLRIEARA